MSQPYVRGHTVRPMPEGFAEAAPIMCQIDLKRTFHAGDAAIKRWLGELGVAPRKNLSIPDGFADAARTMTRRDLMAQFGLTKRMLATRLKKLGIDPPRAIARPSVRKPVPAGFAAVAPTMLKADLKVHYGVGHNTLDRWLKEAGVRAKTEPRKSVVQRDLRPSRSPGVVNVVRFHNYGPEDQAADVLRRLGPVYRCNERGRADDRGAFWRIGNVVVDGDELMARAARKRAA